MTAMRYPAGAHTVAVSASLRLRCDARPGVGVAELTARPEGRSVMQPATSPVTHRRSAMTYALEPRSLGPAPTSSPSRPSSSRATPSPPCSGTRVDAARRPQVWMRQKELGIWRSWTWNADRRGGARDRRRPDGLGLRARRAPLPSCPTPSSSGCWPTWPCCRCGGVSNGIYPTDAAAQVHYLCEDSRHHASCSSKTTSSSTRRWKCATQLPRLQQDRRVRHGRPARPATTRGVISLDDAARPRAANTSRSTRGARASACRGCQPEDLAILVYTSGTTGKPKGAMHSHARPGLHRARLQHADRAGRDRRAHVLPAAVPHRRAHWAASTSRCTPAPCSTSSRTPRRCPRTCARSRPPCSPPCRACGRSSIRRVMIALQAKPAALQQAAYAWAIGVGTQIAERMVLAASRSTASLKFKFTLARWLALDNVRKLIGIHRARFLRHRRGADLARPGQVVPGAGRADARGLGHDRNLRRRPPAMPARAHQARLHRPGRRLQRGALDPAHRRDPGARPQRVHGLPEPAARRPPRPSTPTAGCTPATSARSTTTATSASPTA